MSIKEKLAYTAGIVDGEGTYWRGFHTNGRGEKHYESRIIVVQKDPEVLEWLKNEYGGQLHLMRRLSLGIMRPIWRWSLNGKKAEELAVKLLPYVIVKKKQIKRVLPLETEHYLVKAKLMN